MKSGTRYFRKFVVLTIIPYLCCIPIGLIVYREQSLHQDPTLLLITLVYAAMSAWFHKIPKIECSWIPAVLLLPLMFERSEEWAGVPYILANVLSPPVGLLAILLEDLVGGAEIHAIAQCLISYGQFIYLVTIHLLAAHLIKNETVDSRCSTE